MSAVFQRAVSCLSFSYPKLWIPPLLSHSLPPYLAPLVGHASSDHHRQCLASIMTTRPSGFTFSSSPDWSPLSKSSEPLRLSHTLLAPRPPLSRVWVQPLSSLFFFPVGLAGLPIHHPLFLSPLVTTHTSQRLKSVHLSPFASPLLSSTPSSHFLSRQVPLLRILSWLRSSSFSLNLFIFLSLNMSLKYTILISCLHY